MSYIDEFVLALEDLLAEHGVDASVRNNAVTLGRETVLTSYKNGLEAGTRRARGKAIERKRGEKPQAVQS